MKKSVKELLKDLIVRQSQVGTITTATESINITSTNIDTYAEGATITLQPGSYLVMVYGGFASNTTETNRRVQLYNKTAAESIITVSNWDRWWIAHTLTIPVQITTTTVLAARLSAGVALNSCTTTITAIRVA